MGVQFELRTMVDQALGCPEKGIVNFNMLHKLLHDILNLLGDENRENGFRDHGNEECGKYREKVDAIPAEEKIEDKTQGQSTTMSSR